ncbi:MAG: hypothetical protein NTV51_15660 [Verrucomicrobia bacterium]|nr:hypothetical protein [Verrucomicrobiota bacterium]
MLRSLSLLFVLALAPTLVRGAEQWAQLKLGMTAEQTLAALGDPILKTTGNGFEVWIYNHGSEVVLYGSLIGWTAPAAAKLPERSTDIWSDDDSGETFPTFLALLPKPVRVGPVPKTKPVPTPAVAAPREDVWLPVYAQRRR